VNAYVRFRPQAASAAICLGYEIICEGFSVKAVSLREVWIYAELPVQAKPAKIQKQLPRPQSRLFGMTSHQSSALGANIPRTTAETLQSSPIETKGGHPVSSSATLKISVLESVELLELDYPATEHYELHIFQHRNVFQWITPHGNEICQHAGLDNAAIIHAKKIRRIHGCSTN
jgi:hypothetical protein